MTDKVDETALAKKYSEMTTFQLKDEMRNIASIPNARTNIEALTKMSVLIQEFEKRGIEMPGSKSASSQTHASYQQEDSGSNIGLAILGLVLIVGGIGLSAGTGRIFYGAVIVGVMMLFRSFV